jgi:hypothetical protein
MRPRRSAIARHGRGRLAGRQRSVQCLRLAQRLVQRHSRPGGDRHGECLGFEQVADRRFVSFNDRATSPRDDASPLP